MELAGALGLGRAYFGSCRGQIQCAALFSGAQVFPTETEGRWPISMYVPLGTPKTVMACPRISHGTWGIWRIVPVNNVGCDLP